MLPLLIIILSLEIEKDSYLVSKCLIAKTGLRGTKIFGKRPKIAILDDLVSDEDSTSLASMEKIKDTVYKGVNHALDPTKRKSYL